MWTPRKILEAFQKHSPAHYECLEKIVQAFRDNDLKAVDAAFQQMNKISFDYAITEKIDPQEVLIIKGDFGWSDVGAFDVLYEAQKIHADSEGNVVHGNWEGVDSSNCLIYGNDDKIIATVGLNDIVVVDTPDALLICNRARAHEVKRIVEQLKHENKQKFL